MILMMVHYTQYHWVSARYHPLIQTKQASETDQFYSSDEKMESHSIRRAHWKELITDSGHLTVQPGVAAM
jgi:hypothetical protein